MRETYEWFKEGLSTADLQAAKALLIELSANTAGPAPYPLAPSRLALTDGSLLANVCRRLRTGTIESLLMSTIAQALRASVSGVVCVAIQTTKFLFKVLRLTVIQNCPMT